MICYCNELKAKRRSKLTMVAWIAGERIHKSAEIDCEVITHGEPIRGGISDSHTPQLGTGMISFFLTRAVER